MVQFQVSPFKAGIKTAYSSLQTEVFTLAGGVNIDSEKIHFGMVRLGFPTSAVYPDNGITLRIDGSIIFKGECCIGNDSYLVCGRHGKIVMGEKFKATAGLKIVSECGITFGNHTLVGWGNIFIDTNFHPLFDLTLNKFRKAFGEITIGNNNWFSTNCMTMCCVNTPDNCVFGAKSVIIHGKTYESNCVYGGAPIRLLRRNVKRMIGNDSVRDYSAVE